MSELPALEAALIDAARERQGRQRPAWLRPIPRLLTTGVVAAAALAAVVGLRGDDVEREARPPDPAAGGFARQLELLGVLRERTAADDDPQVRQLVRELGPRAPYARLLGKAPSGGAFTLVPVRRFQSSAQPGADWHRDGLCLMRHGSEGGAGVCGSTRDLLAGRIRGAIAGQVFGVVADHIRFVRPSAGAEPVAVRRNFYVYDDPRPDKTGPIPPPALCTRADVCTAVSSP